MEAAHALEEQVGGALDALGGAALAATEAAAAELGSCRALTLALALALALTPILTLTLTLTR